MHFRQKIFTRVGHKNFKRVESKEETRCRVREGARKIESTLEENRLGLLKSNFGERGKLCSIELTSDKRNENKFLNERDPLLQAYGEGLQ
jgi:hypothetical protein